MRAEVKLVLGHAISSTLNALLVRYLFNQIGEYLIIHVVAQRRVVQQNILKAGIYQFYLQRHSVPLK